MGIPHDREVLARYNAINLRCWEGLERGELTRDQVLLGRFEQLLEDVSFNAGDENMPPFELLIDRKYVEEHLKGENKPAELRKYIL